MFKKVHEVIEFFYPNCEILETKVQGNLVWARLKGVITRNKISQLKEFTVSISANPK